MPTRCSRFLAVLLLATICSRAADSASSSKPLFRDFMGINGHTIQFRPKLYQPVAQLVRDYHPVEWDLGNDSDFAPPFPYARNGVDWRKVYGVWHEAGWRTDVSLMFETLPRERWGRLDADSRAYAQQFARAFGPSGTNAWVESVEIGNEPGKFTDADYRTVFEHMARGIRAGDPKLRIVTGAVTTGKSHDYAKSIQCLAGLESLFDVLNVHTYAQLENWPTWRRSFPEDPRLKEYLPDVQRLCDWRDQHAPGKEVWITEFGYDSTTRKPDPSTEFKSWVGSTDEQQAQWNVRSWLLFATLPVQRAYVYFFNDEDEPKLHGASGLTRHFVPKPSFYAAAHLHRTLGDYRFTQALVQRPGDAMLFEFTDGSDPKRRVWVAWSPTGAGRAGTLDLPRFKGQIERIERMPLRATADPVLPTPATSSTIEISESPTYLFLLMN